MLLTEYETTLVVRPDIGGDAVETTLNRVREAVSSGGGKLLAIKHWGKKKLAYPIAKHTRAIYVHTQYLGDGRLVSELERNLRIADSVLRYLTVRVATRVDPVSRDTQEYVAPEYEAEEELHAAPEQTAEGDEAAEGEPALEIKAADSEPVVETKPDAEASADGAVEAKADDGEPAAEAKADDGEPAAEAKADDGPEVKPSEPSTEAITADTNETKAE